VPTGLTQERFCKSKAVLLRAESRWFGGAEAAPEEQARVQSEAAEDIGKELRAAPRAEAVSNRLVRSLQIRQRGLLRDEARVQRELETLLSQIRSLKAGDRQESGGISESHD